ncbi:hypothetical protein CRENBAI_014865 [Crenichthys baileyi]|uniref:Uncharacterized protein n=1 Tax=Crenichthys baileyi TaxID=28760 RepID=A0AAV9SIS2_9TELE
MVSLLNYGPWRRRPELDTAGCGRKVKLLTGSQKRAREGCAAYRHGSAKRRALGGRTGFAQLKGSQESQPNGSIRDSVLTGSDQHKSVVGKTAPGEQIFRVADKQYRKGKTLRQRSAGAVSSYTAQLMSLMSYTSLSPAPPGNPTWW